MTTAIRACPPNVTIQMKVDNKVVYYGVLKKRFRNGRMHTKLGELLQHMLRENKILALRWVDTVQMITEGADTGSVLLTPPFQGRR